ncbi:hypothetical protein DID80_04590 [Candidatus Marinamargulisbacteria bacterium SCGC AAA071-K20]|nr:hypothetical protein DID80_04590 [Candidatus Marinamargulisbacteria bacterium SCGC AAA071-K20]
MKLKGIEDNCNNQIETFIQDCMNKNFDNGLFVIDSSSFGFNYTHIMHINEPEGNGYIRIAPGMETLADIKKLRL